MLQSDEPRAVTDRYGYYEMSLLPGPHLLRMVVPEGHVQTFPLEPAFHTRSVEAMSVADEADFSLGSLSLSIEDVALDEGDTGETTFTFTVALDNASPSDVTVEFSTVAGTATEGVDYVPMSGMLTVPSGQLIGTISVSVLSDTDAESDESFFIGLSSPTNATLATDRAKGTILNDDLPIVTVTVTDGHASEGDLDVGIIAFNRTGPTDRPLEASYSVSGTAINGIDYDYLDGHITIAAGASSIEVTVRPIDGSDPEDDESVSLAMLPGPAYRLGSSDYAIVTIVDDDLPSLSIADLAMEEGESGELVFPFDVTLTHVSPKDVEVEFSVTNGTAVVDHDYSPVAGILIIPSGQLSGTIAVPVVGDTDAEPDETFYIALSNPANAVLHDNQAKGTILNDDLPIVTIGTTDGQASEHGSDVGVIKFSRTGPTDSPLDVAYSVSGTATNGTDYEQLDGHITIAAGAASVDIGITPINDLDPEADESLSVNLIADPGYRVGEANTATVTIVDDDLPSLSIGNVALEEGDREVSELVFTALLSQPVPWDVTATYETVAGTATADIDYGVGSGSLTILAGQASAAIPVSIYGDSTPEADETFLLNLLSANGASITDAPILGTILNDDVVDLSLTLNSVILPTTVVPGDTIRARVQITNIGNVHARGLGAVQILASKDSAPDAGDAIVGQVSGKRLRVRTGRRSSATVRATIPQSLEKGQYDLIVRLVPEAAIHDDNSANNHTVAGTSDVAHRFGSFDGRRNVRLNLNGSTYQLRGPGYGDVDFADGAADIAFTGTSERSWLRVSKGPSIIRHLDAPQGLKGISGKGIDIKDGVWNIRSNMTSLQIGIARHTTINVLGAVKRYQGGAMVNSTLNADAVDFFRLNRRQGELVGGFNFVDSFVNVDGSLRRADLGVVQTGSNLPRFGLSFRESQMVKYTNEDGHRYTLRRDDLLAPYQDNQITIEIV